MNSHENLTVWTRDKIYDPNSLLSNYFKHTSDPMKTVGNTLQALQQRTI